MDAPAGTDVLDPNSGAEKCSRCVGACIAYHALLLARVRCELCVVMTGVRVDCASRSPLTELLTHVWYGADVCPAGYLSVDVPLSEFDWVVVCVVSGPFVVGLTSVASLGSCSGEAVWSGVTPVDVAVCSCCTYLDSAVTVLTVNFVRCVVPLFWVDGTCSSDGWVYEVTAVVDVASSVLGMVVSEVTSVKWLTAAGHWTVLSIYPTARWSGSSKIDCHLSLNASLGEMSALEWT